jgi:hypothetical protein
MVLLAGASVCIGSSTQYYDVQRAEQLKSEAKENWGIDFNTESYDAALERLLPHFEASAHETAQAKLQPALPDHVDTTSNDVVVVYPEMGDIYRQNVEEYQVVMAREYVQEVAAGDTIVDDVVGVAPILLIALTIGVYNWVDQIRLGRKIKQHENQPQSPSSIDNEPTAPQPK